MLSLIISFSALVLWSNMNNIDRQQQSLKKRTSQQPSAFRIYDKPKPSKSNAVFSADNSQDLQKALSRISQLEVKLRDIEIKSPKKYADVVFLNYKDRKRIMVS